MQQQNEAEGSWKAAIRTLTRNYRHEALGICQEDSSHLGWEISQHLLDQCWVDAIPNAKTASVIYVCPGCGATLHPGFKSACLRVARFPKLKFDRTRRRRNLRRQKRLRLALQKQSKPINRSNTPGETPMVEHVLLRDDQDILFDRHHLTLKCPRCDCRIRLKGVKREAAPTKQDIQRKQVSTSGLVKTSKKTIMKEESSDGGDFLILPPAPASKAATSLAPTMVARAFVQNSKKEKKKKIGHQEKKSKLMSFLSSLND